VPLPLMIIFCLDLLPIAEEKVVSLRTCFAHGDINDGEILKAVE
jgi:hypothetical protein